MGAWSEGEIYRVSGEDGIQERDNPWEGKEEVCGALYSLHIGVEKVTKFWSKHETQEEMSQGLLCKCGWEDCDAVWRSVA